MKCYTHNDTEAVAQCNVCGKFLCKECADVYDPPLCPKCGKEVVTEQLQEARKIADDTLKSAKLWVTLGIIGMFFGALSFGSSVPEGGGVASVVIVIFGAYMGLAITMGLEKALHSKAKQSLSVPIIGWFIFLFVLAFYGAYLSIPEFIKLNKTIKEAKAAKKDLDNAKI